MPLPDDVFNWLIKFFEHCMHQIVFNSMISTPLTINSSVVQGSALGPSLFGLNSSALHPLTTDNLLVKYAVNCYLIVPASNTSSIQAELDHIGSWSRDNNQSIKNTTKSAELIGCRTRTSQYAEPLPPEVIDRVASLKTLGSVLSKDLKNVPNAELLITLSRQTLSCLDKVLKHSGLSSDLLATVSHATLVARLTYRHPTCWGSANLQERLRMQTVLNRVHRWGLSGTVHYCLTDMWHNLDKTLFGKVLGN